MNYRFIFYTSEKARTRRWADALRTGAAVYGDTVEAMPQSKYTGPADCDGAIKLGLNSFTKRAMRDYLAAGKQFLYLDKGYMGRFKGEYYRGSLGGWQPLRYFQRFKRPEDRLLKTGLMDSYKVDLRQGWKVLYAGACQNYSNFCDLGTVNEYGAKVVNNLRRFTNRPIVYRPNPSWARQHRDEFAPLPNTELSDYNEDFIECLKEAYIFVTHGSSAAVTALARGVPVFILGDGICKPMSANALNWDRWNIEEPFWPKERDRYQFFCDLAYSQWTSREWSSGEAWKEIRLALNALSQDKAEISAAEVIEQYKLMHASPKYFRGLSVVKHFARIGQLILKTESKTLLDFGCGKGAQYLSPYELQKGWGVEVKCYDPAVPHLDQLPSRKYDAVICCDVMEHVPESDVPRVLKQVIGYADKFVFFAICAVPAKKQLPDGRNCHLTLRSEEWWSTAIGRAKYELGFLEPGQGPTVKLEVTTKQDEEE